jgi:hypothetical protein
MRYQAIGLILFAAVTLGGAVSLVRTNAPSIDLGTSNHFDSTCASLPSSSDSLENNRQRQAFVVCHDVALVKIIATYSREVSKDDQLRDYFKDEFKKAMFRRKLSQIRDELRTVRQVLEQIDLKESAGILIKPSSWQLDLNGDGEVEPWEKYFFAIPKRSSAAMQFRFPGDSEDYYRKEYNLGAEIYIDQSDISWALSYHYFVESLFETVLAYTINDGAQGVQVELADASAMRRAQELIVKGLKASDHTRKLVLAEKGDMNEWIPSPLQKNSLFPVVLKSADFAVWEVLMQHLIPLFEGKTLIMSGARSGGLLGSFARICPEGSGLNISELYRSPPASLEGSDKEFEYLCQLPDESRRPSGLMSFLSKYSERIDQDSTAGAGMLKYILWVN